MKTVFAFISGIGPMEMVVIGIVALVFFGAKRIPEFARGLGKGVREFKGAINDIKKDVGADELDIRKDIDIRKDLEG